MKKNLIKGVKEQMENNLLDFIRFELSATKTALEIKVEKLPIKDRKPIYQRIKKLRDSIQIIMMFQTLDKQRSKR